MKKMLPLVVFIVFAIVGQVVSVLVALIVEYAGYKVASILVFGVLYIAMYGVAWKLTVWFVDGVLVRKGYVQAAPAELAQPVSAARPAATSGDVAKRPQVAT